MRVGGRGGGRYSAHSAHSIHSIHSIHFAHFVSDRELRPPVRVVSLGVHTSRRDRFLAVNLASGALRRTCAFALLVCWLWLNIAGPFDHTHAAPQPGNGPTISSGAACIACEWQAVQTTADFTPVVPAHIHQLAGRVAIPAQTVFARHSSCLLPSRAPPAIA